MTNGVYGLAEAIGRGGESPCEKYVCKKRADCSARELACASFARYVAIGRAADPHMLWPNKLGTRPRMKHRPRATRGIFERVFSLDGDALAWDAERKQKQTTDKRVVWVFDLGTR